LQGNYGSRFLNQWKTGQLAADGQDVGVVNAMKVWSEKLAGFGQNPDVFGDVLRDLPEEPPALPTFIEMCRKSAIRQRDGQQRLTHKQTTEEIEHQHEMARKVADATKLAPGRDPLDWAKRPRSRAAMHMVATEAKRGRDIRFRAIFSSLVADGRATEDGNAVALWDGTQWVGA
jgi:hypothetical protein